MQSLKIPIVHFFNRLSRASLKKAGNDTIDPYPLIPAETGAILIVLKDIYEELRERYAAFRRGFRRPRRRSSLRKAVRGPILSRKPAQPDKRQILTYQPSNAISFNECDYRRWCRVTEWFREFRPEVEI
jgi:hypothetical protein